MNLNGSCHGVMYMMKLMVNRNGRRPLVQFVLLCLLAVALFSSCHSSRSVYYKNQDMRELARAGLALGFDIEVGDDWALMIESARWMGTPYRYGGNTQSGVDCSGLTVQIYKTVYGKSLHRSSADQYEQDCRKVMKGKLKGGDLVFFVTSGKVKRKNINHVGIYLKDGKFIHASSSRGVVVDNLNSRYYVERWIGGGKVK